MSQVMLGVAFVIALLINGRAVRSVRSSEGKSLLCNDDANFCRAPKGEEDEPEEEPIEDDEHLSPGDLAEKELLRKAIEAMDLLGGNIESNRSNGSAESNRSNGAAIDEVAEMPPELQASGTMFVDAGSSGSKVCSFPIGRCQKVLTECTCGIKECGDGDEGPIKSKIENEYYLKGISALSYNQGQCIAEVHLEKQDGFLLRSDEDKPRYTTFLLDEAKKLHEDPGICGNDVSGLKCQPPVNKHEIPILATAGMRLLPKLDDDNVWKEVCGKPENGEYRFAAPGDDCGTISGTKEALYEFIAANMNRARPTGIATIGGESAQIAVPLRQDQLSKFAFLYKFVAIVIGNGEEVKLPKPETERIRAFNERICARDFVDIVKLDARFPDSERFPYVGLISMLGLERLTGPDLNGDGHGDIGVAGGMNAIEKHAIRKGCGAPRDKDSRIDPEFNFDVCQSKLIDDLLKDQLFLQVVEFFHGVESWPGVDFTFGTNAAIPHMRFRSEVLEEYRIKQAIQLAQQSAAGNSIRMDAWELLMNWLRERCKRPEIKNGRFGVNMEQTPMKTLWAYVFYKSLGLDQWTRKDVMDAENRSHAELSLESVSLHFEELQWTNGKLFEMTAGRLQGMDNDAFERFISEHVEGTPEARADAGELVRLAIQERKAKVARFQPKWLHQPSVMLMSRISVQD